MKKILKTVVSVIVAVCLISASMLTGVVALSDDAYASRNEIIAALESLSVTKDTTSANIEAAVTAVDDDAVITWKVPFTVVMPTDGAIIKLNGEAVDGGVVRAHDGYIKGLLGITSGGATFDVPVDFTLEAQYATVDCTKQATINMTTSKYETESGYDADADLVVIEKPNSGTQWSVPANYFYTSDSDYNTNVKAIIIKYGIANVMDNAFRRMSALEAAVFTEGVTKFYSNAFYGTAVKYVEFGKKPTAKLEFATNSFAWTGVNNLYFGDRTSLKMASGTFTGCRYLKQLTVDIDTVDTITTGSLNTNSDGKSSITTVVCNNSTVAAAFSAANAAVTINASGAPMVDYYGKVSGIKVIEDATADYVETAAKALDTKDAFTVSAQKSDNIFEVAITDANAITATAYVKTFSVADMKANIEDLLNGYAYTESTTQSDITAYIQGALGDGYEIVWLEDYSLSEKADGARVYARVDADSEYTLYGTVPGQDKAAHGKFVIKKGADCTIIEINTVIDPAEYEDYYLTGIQNEASGSDGSSSVNYDGTSELVIIRNTTLYNNCYNAAKIGEHYGENTSKNIKAVIINGVLDKGAWSCFGDLDGLEVVIINNTNNTQLGNGQFGKCDNLKYVYIPDSITTARSSGNASSGSQDAFIKCPSLENILVPEGFVVNSLTTDHETNPKTYANAITRYSEDANAKSLIDFYYEVSTFVSAETEEELRTMISELPDYSEDFKVDIEETESLFTVTIEDLFVVNVAIPCKHQSTTVQGAYAPTCTEKGYTGDTYCLICGEKVSDGEAIEPTGIHTLGEWISDETNHWKVCEECKETFEVGTHTYEWVTTVQATPEADGLKEEICSVCGYKSGASEVVVYKTHTPGDINDDGKVNNKDLTRLFQHLSGWNVEVNLDALDVNGDDKVNNKDLTRLFQHLSGWAVEIF